MEVGRVLDVYVQMRLARIPGIAHQPEQVATPHGVSLRHADRALLHVREKDKLPVRRLQHNMIAGGMQCVESGGIRLRERNAGP